MKSSEDQSFGQHFTRRIQGHVLACPPPADRVQIKSAHSSPVKTLVTIRVQIISASELCILFVMIQMNLYYVSLLHNITSLNKIYYNEYVLNRKTLKGP